MFVSSATCDRVREGTNDGLRPEFWWGDHGCLVRPLYEKGPQDDHIEENIEKASKMKRKYCFNTENELVHNYYNYCFAPITIHID